MRATYLDFPVVVEPELFVILDFHSRERVCIETYGEMILTSDNELLSDDFYNRNLLKNQHFPGPSPENLEYCGRYSICEHTVIGYVQFHRQIPIFMEKYPFVQMLGAFQLVPQFLKNVAKIQNIVTAERMDIFPRNL